MHNIQNILTVFYVLHFALILAFLSACLAFCLPTLCRHSTAEELAILLFYSLSPKLSTKQANIFHHVVCYVCGETEIYYYYFRCYCNNSYSPFLVYIAPDCELESEREKKWEETWVSERTRY